MDIELSINIKISYTNEQKQIETLPKLFPASPGYAFVGLWSTWGDVMASVGQDVGRLLPYEVLWK